MPSQPVRLSQDKGDGYVTLKSYELKQIEMFQEQTELL